jgi:hypothetical protein
MRGGPLAGPSLFLVHFPLPPLRDAKTAFTRDLEREKQYAELRRQAAAKRVVAIVEISVAILEMI